MANMTKSKFLDLLMPVGMNKHYHKFIHIQNLPILEKHCQNHRQIKIASNKQLQY